MTGSRGPVSKPNAVRSPTPQGRKVQLPLNGYQGEYPDWPLVEGTELELLRWEKLWRSPMAEQWVRMHIDTMLARYVRIAILAESADQNTSVAMSNIKGEARQLEKELGIGPAALLRLGWDVADEPEAPAEKLAPVRRLKAVDPEAS